jgi:hypothetical protein
MMVSHQHSTDLTNAIDAISHIGTGGDGDILIGSCSHRRAISNRRELYYSPLLLRWHYNTRRARSTCHGWSRTLALVASSMALTGLSIGERARCKGTKYSELNLETGEEETSENIRYTRIPDEIASSPAYDRILRIETLTRSTLFLSSIV